MGREWIRCRPFFCFYNIYTSSTYEQTLSFLYITHTLTERQTRKHMYPYHLIYTYTKTHRQSRRVKSTHMLIYFRRRCHSLMIPLGVYILTTPNRRYLNIIFILSSPPGCRGVHTKETIKIIYPGNWKGFLAHVRTWIFNSMKTKKRSLGPRYRQGLKDCLFSYSITLFWLSFCSFWCYLVVCSINC